MNRKTIVNTTSLSFAVFDNNGLGQSEPIDCTLKAYLSTEDDTHISNRRKLSNDDLALLYTFEESASLHQDSFQEFCDALYIIKFHKLYRKTHSSFADYCKEKYKLPHVKDRPDPLASVQVPRELAEDIKAFINEDPERVKSMAHLITALANQTPKKD